MRFQFLHLIFAAATVSAVAIPPAGTYWNSTTIVKQDDAVYHAESYSQLAATYTADNFFDEFEFFTGDDPTDGFVKFSSRPLAQKLGLIRAPADKVYMGVDMARLAPNGRRSLRLESKARFTRGLFILDVEHLPWGCGTWPAFWTLGDDWPNNGEIDIIEGVHEQQYNAVALHTAPSCRVDPEGYSGTPVTEDCFVDAEGQGKNQGCAVHDASAASYGDGFNKNGGGVYAMEWTSQHIKVWWWPRGTVPADALGANPAPAYWGMPQAMFKGACDMDEKFRDHKIVFDITFCGDWAGNTWAQSDCASRADTCARHVSENPTAFEEAYWLINSLKVWSS